MNETKIVVIPNKSKACDVPCCKAINKFSGTSINRAIRPVNDICKNAQDIIARIRYVIWVVNK